MFVIGLCELASGVSLSNVLWELASGVGLWYAMGKHIVNVINKAIFGIHFDTVPSSNQSTPLHCNVG